MLRSLDISNYAIIEKTSINFSDNLSIITGETGAGKSILLGALSLILGKRVSNDHVFLTKDKKCIIEGTFDLDGKNLKSFFQENDLDFEAQTSIRREITASGKSRAFVNDTPVNLQVLTALGQHLVNLHAQHQTLYLNEPIYQLRIVDDIAGHKKLLTKYQTLYVEYQKKKNQLARLKKKVADAHKEHDFLSFQLNELNEATIEDLGEQERIEQELKQLENAESIKSTLFEGVQMSSDESSLMIGLRSLAKDLEKLADFGPKLSEFNERIKSTIIELTELGREMSSAEDGFDANPKRTELLNSRLDQLLKLQNKHQVDSLEALLNVKKELVYRLQNISDSDQEIEGLEEWCAIKVMDLREMAKMLSANRKKAIPKLEKTVNGLLAEMGMIHADLKVEQLPLGENQLSDSGADSIRFLFASNKGSVPVDIKKVASGGELSRLMLAIQHLVANRADLPTMVFDEIDTGISGEIAIKVGKVLRRLSRKHQLICITHLPQIACIGDIHFRVFKEDTSEKTISQVEVLEGEDRIIEIGTILSGEPPSEQAKANARELLDFMMS